MRIFLLTLLLLVSKISIAQLDVLYIKGDYGLNFNTFKSTNNFAIEYSHFKDIASYYSATFYGYSTGIQYNEGRIQVPFLWAIKRAEWNDVTRMGVVFDKNIEQTNLYFSFGFDNQFLRHRTDGWVYTIESYVKYNKYRTEVGGRLGIGFTYDKYHYNKWYKNY